VAVDQVEVGRFGWGGWEGGAVQERANLRVHRVSSAVPAPGAFTRLRGFYCCYGKSSRGLLLPRNCAQPGWPGPLGRLDRPGGR
jgi:hypothetical protein